MKELAAVMYLLEKVPDGITNQDDLNLVKGIGNRLFKALNEITGPIAEVRGGIFDELLNNKWCLRQLRECTRTRSFDV